MGSESDLELLETYLDGELPVADAEGLWRRLAAEPELSAQLDQLRADRELRQMVWRSMEPAETSVRRVEAGVGARARRRDVFSALRTAAGVLTAAAACILFGFAMGWLGHENYPSNIPQPAASTGGGIPVVSTADTSRRPELRIEDGSGNVRAVQQFRTPQEEQEFMQDLSRWNQRQSQSQIPDNVVPVSEDLQ